MQRWWIAVCPGLAAMLVVLSFNLCGDRIRDTLDLNWGNSKA